MARDLATQSKMVGLKINKKKTFVMTSDIQELEFVIDDGTIEYVDEFCYLGSLVSFTGDSCKEIARRIKSSWRAFWKLRAYTKIDLKLRMRLFNMCVLPVLTYASDTWTLTTRSNQRLRTTQLAMLRRILRISRRDHIQNCNIFKKCDTVPVDKLIKRRKWKWAGHVARRSDDRWTTSVTSWWPRESGKRSRGRQKKRWKDDFKKSAKDWWQHARDRLPVPPTPPMRTRREGGRSSNAGGVIVA